MRASAYVLAPLCAAGCWVYSPGSYTASTPFPGKRVSLHCLDLAVTLAEDRGATSPVVAYNFGNRCTDTSLVDLAAVRAVARQADGSRVPLHAFDPEHELRPLPLYAWWHGSEEVEYVASAQDAPNVAEVCVDVGQIEPAYPNAEHWICLTARDAGSEL
jgi:hypothetical protein